MNQWAKVFQGPAGWALAIAVAGGVLWLLHDKIKQDLGEAASAAGGILSGNNALTAGTAYEGKGTAGTLGAAADTVSGGALGSIGEWLGGKAADVADWFRLDDVNATPKLQTRKQAVGDNFYDQGVLQ